ncbi:MAG TPA: hypothetical protein ENK67_02920 [Flavobacteriia bacterium]|nr:hypothetical protein [Flavobacteriia bacterium]
MSDIVSKTKKFWLLFALMIGPLLFYLFILKSSAQFRFLPVLNKHIEDVVKYSNDSVAFKKHITIVLFLGDDLLHKKTNALNLNEKIYKRFHKFNDFQFIVILPKGTEEKAKELKNELGFNTDMTHWKFVFLDKKDIVTIFDSFQSPYSLNKDAYVKEVFIIDKNANLRGRNDDEDAVNGMLYGYNAESISTIHKKMVDDVKVLLAEYRLALKKNKKKEVFKNPFKK